jgi:outer membrane cobalamin receptor
VSGGPERAVLPDLETAEGEETSLSAVLAWTPSKRWQAEIIASWAELEDEIDTPPDPPGELDGQPAFTGCGDYRRGQLLWINRLAIDGPADLAFGIDLVSEDGRDDGTVDLGFAVLPNSWRLERTTAAAFLEWGYGWPMGLETTLAGRLDHTGDESRASGKFGLAKPFQAVDGRLWASIADGFKLPSFFALGNPLFGNPELATEKVTSIEAGYDQDLGNGNEAGIALFASEYEDLVDFDFETFTNINRGQVDFTGVFLYLQLQIAPTVWFGADATLSDISSDSGPLRRRQENTGGINLTWRPTAAWSVDMAARYVDERLTPGLWGDRPCNVHGFGAFDELVETMTLVQTRKIQPLSIQGRNALQLDGDGRRQGPDFDRRACGRAGGEILRPHAIVGCKVGFHVGEVYRHVDQPLPS